LTLQWCVLSWDLAYVLGGNSVSISACAAPKRSQTISWVPKARLEGASTCKPTEAQAEVASCDYMCRGPCWVIGGGWGCRCIMQPAARVFANLFVFCLNDTCEWDGDLLSWELMMRPPTILKAVTWNKVQTCIRWWWSCTCCVKALDRLIFEGCPSPYSCKNHKI